METLEKVIAIIKENSNWKDEIGPEFDIRNDLGIESFDMLMIVNAIEDEFSIEVDEADIKEINRVEDIVKLLHEKYL
jgi:acyl carrier protein